MSTTTEVELNLRLDPEYRTTFDPSSSSSQITISSQNENENDANTISAIDYSSKTVMTSLSDDINSDDNDSGNDAKKQKQKLLDDLLFDCEITDCALLPRTFWMPCTGMEPRCTLEKCAMEVFHHHVKGKQYDKSTSGAEWWVQIRPSPSAGRYRLLVQDNKTNTNNSSNDNSNDEHDIDNTKKDQNANDDDDKNTLTSIKRKSDTNDDNKHKDIKIKEETTGICFHWDKDEDLRLLMDGKMYIHPHISTVTYLSDIGAPTVALNYRVDTFTGEYVIPTSKSTSTINDEHNNSNDKNNNSSSSNSNSNMEENVDAAVVEGYLSWPKKGKHLSFDGRYLHGAPSDFMEQGLFEKQIEIPIDQLSSLEDNGNGDGKKQKKIIERRYRRVTFLVNVWLNYKPFNVNVFPESMIDKLSKTDGHTLFQNDDNHLDEENEQCAVKDHTYEESTTAVNKTKYQGFEWAMGSCSDDKESISMRVPISLIQNEIGRNVKLSWPSKHNSEHGIKLSKGESDLDSNEIKKQRIN